MRTVSERLSRLPVSAPMLVDETRRALQSSGRDVVSFCVGEPDFPAPAAADAAGAACISAGGVRYTNASGTPALKAAVTAALQRDYGLLYAPEQIAVTAGAKYAVFAAVMAVTDPGDEVIIPAPYWTSYVESVRLAGATPVTVPCTPEQNWKLTPAQLSAAVTPRTRALILNNPNNPSGAVYTRAELTALSGVCRDNDLFVIADEIYASLVYDRIPFAAAASLDGDMYARTLTVGGVSKTYAMTGWRIGYVAADSTLIRAIGALLSHTTGCPSVISQTAAAAALTGAQDGVIRMCDAFSRRRDRLTSALFTAGVSFVWPQGAFYVMVDVRGYLCDAYPTDLSLALAMLEQAGVATVPLSAFGLEGFLRLSYTLDEARMDEGVRRLAAFLAGCRGDKA